MNFNWSKLVAASLLLLGLGGRIPAQDWAGFHGLQRQGVASESASPLQWSPGNGVTWKTAVPGSGYSSPVVIGDQIYLTTAYETTRGTTTRVVLRAATVVLTLALIAMFLATCHWTIRGTLAKTAATLAEAGFVLFVALLCLFAEQLFALDASIHRSWKFGTCLSALVSSGVLLVAPQRWKIQLLLPATLTLLSVASYVFMPRRELFMTFNTSDAAVSTAVVLLPALLGVAVLAFLPLLQRWIRDPEQPATLPLRKHLRTSAVIAVLFLAAVCFVRFGCLPARKQMAYAVASIDKRTGNVSWLREVTHSDKLADLKEINSRATPTLATTADTLCAYFGSQGLFGLDLQGNVKWQARNVAFEGQYGVGHSPTLANGIVVVAADSESASGTGRGARTHIVAYRVTDGQLLWQHTKNSSKAGFSTPIIRGAGERAIVLVRNWDELTGYDLQDGKLRWTYPLKFRGHHLVASLIADEKNLYLSDATRVMALKLQALETGEDPLLWSVPMPGEKVATPLIRGNALFGVTENGTAWCIDAEKGALAWKDKLSGRFFASVVAPGENVIFTSEAGETWIYKNSTRPEPVGQSTLAEKIYATPAPQSSGLLVRTVNNLYCIQGREKSPAKLAQSLVSNSDE